MRLIGVTGGVGSGKSALLSYFKEHLSCRVLLSDEAAHEVYAPGGPIYRELVELLEADSGHPGLAAGAEKGNLLNDDGTIYRPEFARRMFGNELLRKKVDALVHPAVIQYIKDQVEQERRSAEKEYFFLEAALLIENGFLSYVDEMWYVYCRHDERIRRLKASRGYSDEKIAQIISSQMSEEQYRKYCSFVIDNSGTLADSVNQVEEHLGIRIH